MSMSQVFEQSLFLFLPVLGKGEQSIGGRGPSLPWARQGQSVFGKGEEEDHNRFPPSVLSWDERRGVSEW